VATLHVRNVPDGLMANLRERARLRRRSLSTEIISILEGAAERDAVPVAELLERIHARLACQPLRSDVPDSVELIREDRER